MPRRIPRYVRHKARNKGKVTINGRTHYLPGDYDSDESRSAYDQLIAEYLAKKDAPSTANVTFRYLAVEYMKFCEQFYVDEDGAPTEEINQIRRAVKPLLKLFGREKVNSFGPKKLKRVREEMISSGLYRTTINDRVSRVVRMLSWAVEEEFLIPSIVDACREVRNLQKGRCGDVPESKPVLPVEIDRVERVREHLGPVVSAMVELELVTGMRPQEVRNITWGQIDRGDSEVWCYEPDRHKTKRKGKTRRVYIGPNGQEILLQFLKADPDAFIFSPRESEEIRRANQRQQRKSPLTPSQRARDARERGRMVAAQYTKDSYRRAITRACEKAFNMPEHLRRISTTLSEPERERLRAEAKAWREEHCWTPNQLRHACGTFLRKEVGLDGARTVLGHSEKRTTEIYAEKDFEQARSIMARLG